jgi:hypothetical protein
MQMKRASYGISRKNGDKKYSRCREEEEDSESERGKERRTQGEEGELFASSC